MPAICISTLVPRLSTKHVQWWRGLLGVTHHIAPDPLKKLKIGPGTRDFIRSFDPPLLPSHSFKSPGFLSFRQNEGDPGCGYAQQRPRCCDENRCAPCWFGMPGCHQHTLHDYTVEQLPSRWCSLLQQDSHLQSRRFKCCCCCVCCLVLLGLSWDPTIK